MTLYTLDREKREKRLQALMGDMGMALPAAPPPPPANAFALHQAALPDAVLSTLPGLDEAPLSALGEAPLSALGEAPCAPLPPDRGELLRELEGLREKFEGAREEPLEAVLILADLERGAQSLRDGCLRLKLRAIADLLALLSATLKRSEPLNTTHMELLSLQLEAARAMFRHGSDQPEASAELLHALRAATRRQFNGAF